MTQQPSSVNPWKYIFTIPLDAKSPRFSRENGNQRIELETINNKAIECSGLQWRIYLHQEIDGDQERFALSVIPVNSIKDNTLPVNYTMSYTVNVKLISRRTDGFSMKLQKSAPPTEHQWTRSYRRSDSDHKIADHVDVISDNATDIESGTTAKISDFTAEESLAPLINEPDIEQNEVTEASIIPPISHDVDLVNDEQEFQHRPVRAWRFDVDQQKWRGRGKGQVTVYWNKENKLGKLVFMDEKHQKVRLIQWINGKDHCEHPEAINTVESNNAAPNLEKEEVEWFGTDYTMDKPMTGRWKFNFMGDLEASDHFVRVWNDHVDTYNEIEWESEEEESDSDEVKSQSDDEREMSEFNDELYHMEDLPFSKEDIIEYFCDDGEDYFYLDISIRTKFKRDTSKRIQYCGLLGAILRQSEREIEKHVTGKNKDDFLRAETAETTYQLSNGDNDKKDGGWGSFENASFKFEFAEIKNQSGGGVDLNEEDRIVESTEVDSPGTDAATKVDQENKDRNEEAVVQDVLQSSKRSEIDEEEQRKENRDERHEGLKQNVNDDNRARRETELKDAETAKSNNTSETETVDSHRNVLNSPSGFTWSFGSSSSNIDGKKSTFSWEA